MMNFKFSVISFSVFSVILTFWRQDVNCLNSRFQRRSLSSNQTFGDDDGYSSSTSSYSLPSTTMTSLISNGSATSYSEIDPVTATSLSTTTSPSGSTVMTSTMSGAYDAIDDDSLDGDSDDDLSGLEDDEDEVEPPFRVPQDAVEFMDYFDDLMKTVRRNLEEVFEKYLPQLFEMSSSVVLSPDCTYDVVRVLLALREMKPWAIKLLDASGKVPEGILSGTLSSLGDYDECLETRLHDSSINGIDAPDDNRVVTGQYCSIDIKPFLPPKPPVNSLNRVFNDAADAKGFPKKDHFSRLVPIFYYLKFRLGVCVPSSCTTSDLKTITSVLSMKIRLNVTAERCEVKESFYANYSQIVAGSAIILITFIVMVATFIDVIRRFFSTYQHKPLSAASSSAEMIKQKSFRSLLKKCWLSFSFYTNCPKVLTTSIPVDSINCLYGLKTINLMWIILAHAYLTLDLKAVGQLLQTQKVNSLFFFQIIMNASLAVETFFFISGLLITLSVMRRLKANPNIQLKEWIWFYVHRLTRMTPAVVLVIAIVLSAYQMSDGPLWREIIYPSAERCRKNWWIHFLHISNFFDVSRMCFLHLWYIAADIQLFLFTPFILILLFRKPDVGRCVILILSLVSVVSTGVVTFMDQLPPTLIFDNPDPLSRKPFGNLVLVKPYPHAAPYLIGMLTGYFIHVNEEFKLSKVVTSIGWCLSTLITCTTLFITWQWNQGHHPHPIFGAVYAGVFRGLWAVAMAWVVVACHYGKGGLINTILCWSPFVPMSRVSYTAYLIHPGLMYVFVASTRNLFMFSHFLVMYLFLSHLMATFIVSFILALIIEIPFVMLETVFYKHYIMSHHGSKDEMDGDESSTNSSSDDNCSQKKQDFYYQVTPVEDSDLISHNLNHKRNNQLFLVKNGSSTDMNLIASSSFSRPTSHGSYYDARENAHNQTIRPQLHHRHITQVNHGVSSSIIPHVESFRVHPMKSNIPEPDDMRCGSISSVPVIPSSSVFNDQRSAVDDHQESSSVAVAASDGLTTDHSYGESSSLVCNYRL